MSTQSVFKSTSNLLLYWHPLLKNTEQCDFKLDNEHYSGDGTDPTFFLVLKHSIDYKHKSTRSLKAKAQSASHHICSI